MKIVSRTLFFTATMAAFVPAMAIAGEMNMKMMWTPPSGMEGKIAESHAQILTSPEGAAMRMETGGLTPGHVVSIWFVVIQSPENCEARPCPPTDPMGRSAEVNSIAAHGGGAVVGDDGRVSLASFIPIGEVASNFFDTQLTSPETAEIHLALHDHGPLIADAAADMLSSYRGGCNDQSIPKYYPEIAASFGSPGPNDCGTIQVALFMQGQ